MRGRAEVQHETGPVGGVVAPAAVTSPTLIEGLFAQQATGVAEIDLYAGRALRFNPCLSGMLGYDARHPYARQLVLLAGSEAHNALRPPDVQVRRHDGGFIRVRLASLSAGPGVALLIVAATGDRSTDAERTARDYRDIYENVSEGIYRSSLDGRQVSANPALVRLNGYATEMEMLAAVGDIGAEWYVDPNRRAEFARLLEENGRIENFVSEIYRHRTRERILDQRECPSGAGPRDRRAAVLRGHDPRRHRDGAAAPGGAAAAHDHRDDRRRRDHRRRRRPDPDGEPRGRAAVRLVGGRAGRQAARHPARRARRHATASRRSRRTPRARAAAGWQHLRRRHRAGRGGRRGGAHDDLLRARRHHAGALRGRAARRQGGGRARQPRQVRLLGDDEPRAAHAAERGDRHGRPAARRHAGRGRPAPRRDAARGRRPPGAGHQQRPRLQQARSRPHGVRGHRVRAGGRGAWRARPLGATRPRPRHRPRRLARARRAGPRRRRSGPAAPGADQPDRQRHQVHRTRRRLGGSRGGASVGRRAGHRAGGRRARHRRRHRRGADPGPVQGFHPARPLGLAPLRRHRARSRDQQPPGRRHGRQHRRQQPARSRQLVPFHRAAAPGRGPGPGAEPAAAAGLAAAGGRRRRHQPLAAVPPGRGARRACGGGRRRGGGAGRAASGARCRRRVRCRVDRPPDAGHRRPDARRRAARRPDARRHAAGAGERRRARQRRPHRRGRDLRPRARQAGARPTCWCTRCAAAPHRSRARRPPPRIVRRCRTRCMC